MAATYQPLAGVKVLDLGILIPPALTSAKLVALGADVVKVEQPPWGDRIRAIPPFGDDGESPQHMAQNWGKRSIALDLRSDEGRATFLRLADVADVIVENQLAGSWARLGIDFATLRSERPELVVCSITGFGQTGPYATLPSHGLNMDALADTMNLDWIDGEPRLGWTFTSWGNEFGIGVCGIGNRRRGALGPHDRRGRVDRSLVLGRAGRVAPHRDRHDERRWRAVQHARQLDRRDVQRLPHAGRQAVPHGRAGAEVLGGLLLWRRTRGPGSAAGRRRADPLRMGRRTAPSGARRHLRNCHRRRMGPSLPRVGCARLEDPRDPRSDGARALRGAAGSSRAHRVRGPTSRARSGGITPANEPARDSRHHPRWACTTTRSWPSGSTR